MPIRALLCIVALGAAPALAADGPLAVPIDEEPPRSSPPADDDDAPLALPADAPRRPPPPPSIACSHGRAGLPQCPDRRQPVASKGWYTVGMPMGVTAWRSRGFRTFFGAAVGADVELGYRHFAMRPNVNLHLGSESVDVAAGIGAAFRGRADPRRVGPLFGVHAALGTSRRGLRAVIGPELGVTGRNELRARVGATWTPRANASWQTIGAERPGVLVELSWRPNGALPPIRRRKSRDR